jgi:hypothetical protein
MALVSCEGVRADQIKRGDTIWAPDDGDWLLVNRVVPSEYDDGLIFFRRDYSEAFFPRQRSVLRRATSATESK